jgi:hypothetical protein
VPRNILDLNANENPIWTTQYAPPSYENIYNSSSPINNLPDYETAKKKSIMLYSKNSAVLTATNNKLETSIDSYQQEQQIQASSNNTDLADDSMELNLDITTNENKINETSLAENSEESFLSVKEDGSLKL